MPRSDFPRETEREESRPDTASRAAHRRSRAEASFALWALLTIVVAAVLLRFLFLAKESLWFDEAYSVVTAQQDAGTFFRVLRYFQPHIPLHFVLLRIWLIVGSSEFAVRSLSALLGIATVPLLYVMGRDLFDRRVGLVSAALLAVNAFHLHYSQEARGYTLLALLLTAAALSFARIMEGATRSRWVLFVFASILAVYTHLFAVLVLMAYAISLALRDRRFVPWKALGSAYVIIGLAMLPMLYTVFTDPRDHVDWIRPLRPVDALYFFKIASGESLSFGLSQIPGPLGASFILCWLAALWLAVQAARRSTGSMEAWRLGFLVSWAFWPVLVLFAASIFKPYYVARYLLMVLPPLLLLAGLALSRIGSRRALAPVLFIMLSLGILEDYWYYKWSTKTDWRDAVRYLASAAQPSDGVIIVPPSGAIPFQYYRSSLPDIAAQRIVVGYPGPWNPASLFGVNLPNVPSADALESLSARYDRTWVVFAPGADDAAAHDVQAALAARYVLSQQKPFTELKVLQYTKRPPNPATTPDPNVQTEPGSHG